MPDSEKVIPPSPFGGDANHRSGFVALAGRPNAGKSTLTNAMVGSKVAITSDKPQTTRRVIRGVVSTPESQLVLVDLPGVQKPRDSLTGRMQKRVDSAVRDADLIVLVVNAEQGIGAGDRYIAAEVAKVDVPKVIAVNKTDSASREQTMKTLLAAAALEVSDDIFPISARTQDGVAQLLQHVTAQLPLGPRYFDSDDSSDQHLFVQVAELIREQVLSRTFHEVPHAVEVMVEDIEQVETMQIVTANIWVETQSQKGILIGSHGKMIKAIGTAARLEIKQLLGTKVHLDLVVKVRRGWRGDESLLDRLDL